MKEKTIQNEIRLALNEYAIVFRANVGNFMTRDGRMVSTGLPKGFSDLFGVRKSDGKAFFFEVKSARGRVRPEQEKFIEQMKKSGAVAEVVRSAEDAIRIITDSE